MRRKISLVIVMSLISNTAFASINDDLSKVWTSLGGESVSNGARYYEGQKRGHYTMGSMYFAKQKKNRPLVSVNFPEIDLDSSCYNQGVLNFGGMSFISGDELKNKLQGITQQAGMMFAYLGISSISPVIGETLQEVYSKLQEVNGFLADECQATKQVVSLVGDKLSQHSDIAKDIFTRFHTSKGGKKDLSSAYKEFPKGKSEALNEAAEKDERLILQNINLAWKAMEKLQIASPELKELMMTVSGTIVIGAPEKDHGMPKVRYIASKVMSPNMLEALLKGGKNMMLLSCKDDNSKCLDIGEKDKLIEEKDSFEHRVSAYFDKFRDALEKDIELDDSAKKFLGNAGIPAYSMYDVLYQHTNAHPEYEQGILVEIVAWNILYNYLTDILREVNEAADNLHIAASEELKEFKASLKASLEMLSNFEMKDLSRYKLHFFMVNRSEKMEDAMSDEVARIINMAKTSY